WTGRHGFHRGYDNFRTPHRGAVERDDACDANATRGHRRPADCFLSLARVVKSRSSKQLCRAGGERDPWVCPTLRCVAGRYADGGARRLKQYLGFIETDDWPEMARGGANLRRIPLGLADAMKALISFRPVAPEQRLAQERAVIAIEQALEARRDRIVLSQA